eukprot:3886889-Lingulodinium_polyedra.AAC.1
MRIGDHARMCATSAAGTPKQCPPAAASFVQEKARSPHERARTRTAAAAVAAAVSFVLRLNGFPFNPALS